MNILNLFKLFQCFIYNAFILLWEKSCELILFFIFSLIFELILFFIFNLIFNLNVVNLEIVLLLEIISKIFFCLLIQKLQQKLNLMFNIINFISVITSHLVRIIYCL